MELSEIDEALRLIPEARRLLTDEFNKTFKLHLEAKQNLEREEAKQTLTLMAKYDIDGKKGAEKQVLMKKIKCEVVELLHEDRMKLICLEADVERLHQDIKSMTESGIGLNVRMSMEKELVKSGVHMNDNYKQGVNVFAKPRGIVEYKKEGLL